jgi:acyl-CoA synthetase (AMP-forming)/AMP-acid ligase II
VFTLPGSFAYKQRTGNSPEMIFALCAISKLGAAPAMINTALRSDYTLIGLSSKRVLTECDR